LLQVAHAVEAGGKEVGVAQRAEDLLTRRGDRDFTGNNHVTRNDLGLAGHLSHAGWDLTTALAGSLCRAAGGGVHGTHGGADRTRTRGCDPVWSPRSWGAETRE